jgi:hypothetical protein
VLKKIFTAATTLTLLVGCYFGYAHFFDVVVERLKANRDAVSLMFPVHDSESKLEAMAVARAGFGPNHWSTGEHQVYRYYNAERGFWMYSKKVDRIVEEDGVKYDGKRLRMQPFALIWKSRDGKDTKTITSDVAVFDLNEPLGLNVTPHGETLKIKHARIERDVLITDDHGTPGVPGDDMHIGPLTAIEYDEPTQKIESDSDTVIRDRDMRVTGSGLEIKLRSGGAISSRTSAGFQGAEYAILHKNVHVEMRDAGKSGVLPDSAQRQRASSRRIQDPLAAGSANPTESLALADEPTPLDVKCDGLMRVDLPRSPQPINVGPPEPPQPTFVCFERNVVVLRGQTDRQPDQLTCDTLILTMVPQENLPLSPDQRQSQLTPNTTILPTSKKAETPPILQAQQFARTGGSNHGAQSPADPTRPHPSNTEDRDSGLFGSLTLRRAVATGHAVWLYLPVHGVKVRCNELRHKRQLPYKSDETYLRGDTSRPLELVKQDTVQDHEDSDFGKVTSVTYIKTVDATIFDSGTGFDFADVVANGPGRLETRPDQNLPVERIAIWQDKLTLQNEFGPERQLTKKILDLTGNRPCFIDKIQGTSLDAGFWLRVWLKPKRAPQATAIADRPRPTAPLFTATHHADKAITTTNQASNGLQKLDRKGNESNPGSGFQVERLLAVRDAHLLVPLKTMTARQRLDAEFVDAEAAPPAPATTASADNDRNRTIQSSDPAATAGATLQQSPDQQTTEEHSLGQDQDQKQSVEPAVTGSAERIWAKIALIPVTSPDKRAVKQSREAELQERTAGTRSAAAGSLGSNAEVRNVWMWGSVSLHQEPAEGKTEGQDATGEALYLENRGKDRTLTYIYTSNPTEDPPRPGPLPFARVETVDRSIAGELIRIDQAADRLWVDGPGMSTQLTERGLLSDKTPEEGTNGQTPENNELPRGTTASRPGASATKPQVRETGLLTPSRPGEHAAAPPSQSPDLKETGAMRAGRPLSTKVPLTVTWTKSMEFMGRSIDPDGGPSARAVFHGTVNAQVEDGMLHCTDHMITYTDQEIPLARLGTVVQPGAEGAAKQQVRTDNDAASKPQLALIECFGNAVAINRKVHPDHPLEIQRQRIEAEYLSYDRRTGEFEVPVKGIVYLYDLESQSSEFAGLDSGSKATDARAGGTDSVDNPNQRRVTPTSARLETYPSEGRTLGPGAPRSTTAVKQPASGLPPSSAQIPPLVLTQVRFTTGMRGRFGTGNGSDASETRWAEFFGNVQAARAQVKTVKSVINEDKLPPDGFFLTGQVLRVITEPPAPGLPPSTPARKYVKAWDKAAVRNSDTVITADVITYDSGKDLIYANGEQGRGVSFAQQYAVGQPSKMGGSRAVQLNPKTGMLNLIDSERIQMIDKKTGERPTRIAPPDPNKKPPKKRKPLYKLPNNTMERRGFTGQ